MKTYLAQFITVVTLCMLLSAVKSHAQLAEKKIDISFKEENLNEALKRIVNEAKLPLAYDGTTLGLNKIMIKARAFKSAPVKEVLTWLFINTNISFKETDGWIALFEKPVPVKPKSGTIKGRVVDFETANPLSGATVLVLPLKRGISTDDNGYYKIEGLPEGSYTLEVSFVGFETTRMDRISITGSVEAEVDVKIKVSSALSVVRVSGVSRRKVVNATDAKVIQEVRASRSVVSGVSNEQIVRSMDRDAAEVVKRISAVSLNDDRFVVVRGLNQRYNATFLNNNLAPSTEPDSRAFSYDLINSNIIDRIMLYKSPAPDLPGEFAGGVVKIYTKNAMPTRQIDFQISTQYRPGSSFSDFNTYKGGKYDLLGFDDGTRRLPNLPSTNQFNYLTTAENVQYAKMFKNIYSYTSNKTNLDKRALFNYYNSWKLLGKRINNLTSVSYTQSYDHNIIDRQLGNSDGIRNYSKVDKSTENIRLSLIQTNSITIRDSSRLELKNFVTQTGQDNVLITVGSKEGFFEQEEKRVSLAYQNRFLYSGQLSGRLYFNEGKTLVSGNIGVSLIRQEEPDFREIVYRRSKQESVGPFEKNRNESWRQGGLEASFQRRMFTKISENAYLGSVDIEHTFSNGLMVKAGTMNEFKNRDLRLRVFSPINAENYYDTDPLATEERIEEKYRPESFREDGSGNIMREFTTPNDSYIASNQNNSGYVAINIPVWKEKLEFYGGLRVESNRLRIVGSKNEGQAPFPIIINQPITSWLPSLNITYKPDDKIVVRAAYGKTLNRPEFREIAPFTFFDFRNLQYYIGNTNLTTANIHNYDLRFEFYPASQLRNEMFNIGAFYKTIDHPIEAVLDFDKNSQRFYPDVRFMNTGLTKIYGVEAEVRKNLSFMPGNIFRNLSIILNGAYIHSRVNVPPSNYGSSNFTERKRPLQGQAPYILNAALSYEKSSWGTKATITYFSVGPTLQFAGNNDFTPNNGTPSGPEPTLSGFADVFQASRNLLDFAITQRINKYLQIKAGVQDILNSAILLFEDQDRNFKYNKEKLVVDPVTGNSRMAFDNVFSKHRPGSYYSLSLNFIF